MAELSLNRGDITGFIDEVPAHGVAGVVGRELVEPARQGRRHHDPGSDLRVHLLHHQAVGATGSAKRQLSVGLLARTARDGAVRHRVRGPPTVAALQTDDHYPRALRGPVAAAHTVDAAGPHDVVPIHAGLHGERIRRGAPLEGLVMMHICDLHSMGEERHG